MASTNLIPRENLGWMVGEGQSDGIRSLTAFYLKESSNSNVSVLISGLGADYTKLELFGKVDEFAETLVSGLDRSWQRPPGVAAKLIDTKSKNGMYYIEYSLQAPGENIRHIYSVLGMQSFGYYNKLYIVTGRFMEDESEKYGSKIQKKVEKLKSICLQYASATQWLISSSIKLTSGTATADGNSVLRFEKDFNSELQSLEPVLNNYSQAEPYLKHLAQWILGIVMTANTLLFIITATCVVCFGDEESLG